MVKIAIIKLGALGDIFWALPYIQSISRSIKNRYPHASIVLITKPMYASFANTIPFIDSVLCDERKSGFRALIHQTQMLKNQHFHAVYDLQMVERTLLYALLLKMFGWRGAWYGNLPFGRGIAYKKTKIKANLRFDNLLQHAHIPTVDFTKEDYTWLEQKPTFPLPKQYIVFAPGNVAIKQWPSAYYAKLALLIAQQYHIPSIIIGNHQQKKLAQSIVDHHKTNIDHANSANSIDPIIIDCTCQTTMSELAYIFNHAVAAIGGDTGPMHLSQLLRTPSLLLFAKNGDSMYTGDPHQFIFSPSTISLMVENLQYLSPEVVFQQLSHTILPSNTINQINKHRST